MQKEKKKGDEDEDKELRRKNGCEHRNDEKE